MLKLNIQYNLHKRYEDVNYIETNLQKLKGDQRRFWLHSSIEKYKTLFFKKKDNFTYYFLMSYYDYAKRNVKIFLI